MEIPLHDPLEKTIKIPLSLKGEKLTFLYNKKIKLSDLINECGAAELVVPAFSAKNQRIAAILNKNYSHQLIPKNTRLFCQFSMGLALEKQYNIEQLIEKRYPIDELFIHYHYRYATVILLEDLHLKYRGMKAAQLSGCKVHIPKLDKEAKSLNHAYTLLSQEIQPQRTAHTGNVFQKFYMLDKKVGLFSIEQLRAEKTDELNKQVANELKEILADNKNHLFSEIE